MRISCSIGADDLPPPPPPLETAALADYNSCSVNNTFPPPPEELPPPPSPVSSSYSELRRATQPNQDYNNYGVGSQVFLFIFLLFHIQLATVLKRSFSTYKGRFPVLNATVTTLVSISKSNTLKIFSLAIILLY